MNNTEKNNDISGIKKRFEDYDYQKYLEDKSIIFEKGLPVGRELW